MLVFTKMRKIRGGEILKCKSQEFYFGPIFILCKVRLTCLLEAKGRF